MEIHKNKYSTEILVGQNIQIVTGEVCAFNTAKQAGFSTFNDVK